MAARDVPAALDRASFERGRTALLCSEPRATQCHRGILSSLSSPKPGRLPSPTASGRLPSSLFRFSLSTTS